MVDRRDVGSWLEGPGSMNPDATPPGVRLGLPADGPGSVARLGRRVAAIIVDFLLCELIATLFGFRLGQSTGDYRDFLPPLIFLVENIVLIGTAGATIGHRLLRLRVVRIYPNETPPQTAPAGLLAAVIRSVLLCLVVPAFIWNRDQRGWHDQAAGTVLVRS